MVRKSEGDDRSELDNMISEAIKSEDYETAKKLLSVDKETQEDLNKEKVKGVFHGYFAAIGGLIVGLIVKKIIKSNDDDDHTLEG